ncbi:uncharacterized protein EMH_0065230 [Eimeria mitis]|uniref:Uncharacterized protein n=1 Tax=Eimeria mitis TaxID=44415 RepID=U6KIY8_9EIME|nr:uncharacterized protein EMH_0065230 [Eimeria mitis]CDJ36247.1 hypothetical protein, conserved [Eimeria mitis]
MEDLEGVGPATHVTAPPDLDRSAGNMPTQKQAVVKSQDERVAANTSEKKCLSACWSKLAAKFARVDRRICYMFCMFLSTLHPVIALYMVTYKDCPLDDLGQPIPDYQPPPPCALDASGEKVDPNCIDPPLAYARVENICYMYLVNEFALHVTYVLYVKVWTLGGRNVGFWREMSGYAGYFVIEFLSNAAVYHVQTFPKVRALLPFFNHFTWPLYAAFIFGSILLIPLGLYLAKTRDQYRRALIFHLPGIVFFGVDVFNRTVFLPFFETMQHKFAQLQLAAIISFIGELALANFYGSIFLPATHKATNVLVEFGYNVSYQTGQELPSGEEDESEELLQQDSEEGVRVLLELEGLSNSDIVKQNSEDLAVGLGLGKAGNQKPPSNVQRQSESQRKCTSMEDNLSGGGETVQRNHKERNGSAIPRRGGRTFEQRSRGSRLGSKNSTFSTAARQSRILAPIVASVDYIPPSQPHVPIRPDGPDPLEFDKILCCFAIVWDAWRYLLIRTVLMKASSIYLYLLMVFKDFAFSYFHFGYAYTERRVLLVIEGATTEEPTAWNRTKHFLFKFFELFIVRPFFMTTFLATTVWRTEIMFGMNERRQNYSHSVYEEPSSVSREENVSLRKTIRLVNARKPTASDWASAISTVAVQKGKNTKGFVGSLFSDMWTHLVLNLRRDWRHWKAKDFSRYTHPVEHWKKKMTVSKNEEQNRQKENAKFDGLEVRYRFANECCIIRHVPPKPKTPRIRSGSQMMTGAEEPHRPSGESVFRRINAVWLSKVVREIQSLVFNRCWPRILQKLVSSTVFVITELFTENSTVGLLPSYQEHGLFRDTMGRFRVLFMFSMDIVEVTSIWITQAQSRFYGSIKKGYNLFHDLAMVFLCTFNCAAQMMNFAMLRYIRFAPICGDKRVLPDNVQQDMLKHLNLVKYWDQPDL